MKIFICLVFCCFAFFTGATFASSYSFQLHEIRISDLARVIYGDALRQSFVLDSDVLQSEEKVSLNWINLDKVELDRNLRQLLHLHGCQLVLTNGVMLVRKSDKQDDEVFIYKPRNRSAKYLSDILQKVADANQLGTRGLDASPSFQNALAKTPEASTSASSQVDRSAPDQLAYKCLPSLCIRLKKLLAQLDTPEAQVVLRAAVYEVGTTQSDGSAIQVATKLLNGRLNANLGTTIASAANLHLVVGGLDAVLSILDQDSRFKVVSRPMLRVRTGAQAKFSVGQQVPVLGAVSQDRNGNPIQSVEYRQSGTIFTVQPDIRLDVVDLNITQELSTFVTTTTGVNNSPTLMQRTATSQLTIKPGEVVVFAGLQEQRDDQTDSRLFGWLLGNKNNSTTSEVLLFIEAQSI